MFVLVDDAPVVVTSADVEVRDLVWCGERFGRWMGFLPDAPQRLIVSYPPRVSIVDERGRVILSRISRARMSGVFCVLVAVVIGAAGFLIGSSRDRHAATAMVLRGTVTWSNEETRLIAFERDAVVRLPNDGDTMYAVLIDGWRDAKGVPHSDNIYPTCLASEDDSPVSMDRHRVELTVIDGDTGGVQPVHVAVHIRCLD